MPRLSEVTKFRVGSIDASAVYFGLQKLWPIALPTVTSKSPANIPGLIRWGSASDVKDVANGALVTSVKDKVTGATYNNFNTVGPLYRPQTIGGKPGLEFPGTAKLLESIAASLPSTYSVWAVTRKTSGGATPVALGMDSANGENRTFQLGWASASVPRFVTFYYETGISLQPTVDNGPSIANASPAMYLGIATSTSADMWVNGASNGATITPAGKTIKGGAGKITVGGAEATSTGYNFAGVVCEWGVYDHALTEQERIYLDSWAQDNYQTDPSGTFPGITVADYNANANAGSSRMTSPALTTSPTLTTSA